jgi:hypothetical protein
MKREHAELLRTLHPPALAGDPLSGRTPTTGVASLDGGPKPPPPMPFRTDGFVVETLRAWRAGRLEYEHDI